MLGGKSSSIDAGPAKHFHFAVTWSSLTAHLEPCEIQDLAEATRAPIEAASYVQSSAPSPASLMAPVAARNHPAASASDGRWEMVVPKMVRLNPKPAATVPSRPMIQAAAVGRGAASAHAEMFAFTSQVHSKPLFSRVLTAIGQGSRRLLAAPDVQVAAEPAGSAVRANGHTNGGALQTLQLNGPAPILQENHATLQEQAKNRPAAVESALARIINGLNRRSERAGSFAASISDERKPSGVL
jgi:hypothetical protein